MIRGTRPRSERSTSGGSLPVRLSDATSVSSTNMVRGRSMSAPAVSGWLRPKPVACVTYAAKSARPPAQAPSARRGLVARQGLPLAALVHHAASHDYYMACPVRDAAEYPGDHGPPAHTPPCSAPSDSRQDGPER